MENIKNIIIKYLVIATPMFIIGNLIGYIWVHHTESAPVQNANVPQHIEVITYDTLETNNAHVSVVTIDSAKYVVVKYGKSVAIAPHRR